MESSLFGSKWTPAARDKLAELVEAGLTSGQISRQLSSDFGVFFSRNSVCSQIVRSGLQLKGQSRRRFSSRKRSSPTRGRSSRGLARTCSRNLSQHHKVTSIAVAAGCTATRSIETFAAPIGTTSRAIARTTTRERPSRHRPRRQRRSTNGQPTFRENKQRKEETRNGEWCNSS